MQLLPFLCLALSQTAVDLAQGDTQAGWPLESPRLSGALDLAQPGRFALSLELGRVYKRDLEDATVTGTRRDSTGNVAGELRALTRVGGMELETKVAQLRIAHGLHERGPDGFGLEAYALIGAASSVLDASVSRPGRPRQAFHVEGETGLVFGAGVRARLYSREELTLLADASFRGITHDSVISQKKRVGLNLQPNESSTQDFETDLAVWELAVLASYEAYSGRTQVAPYAGLRVSGVRARVDGEQSFFDPAFAGTQSVEYRSDEQAVLGAVLGLNVGFSEDFVAYFEASLLDGTEVSVAAEVRF